MGNMLDGGRDNSQDRDSGHKLNSLDVMGPRGGKPDNDDRSGRSYGKPDNDDRGRNPGRPEVPPVQSRPENNYNPSNTFNPSNRVDNTNTFNPNNRVDNTNTFNPNNRVDNTNNVRNDNTNNNANNNRNDNANNNRNDNANNNRNSNSNRNDNANHNANNNRNDANGGNVNMKTIAPIFAPAYAPNLTGGDSKSSSGGFNILGIGASWGKSEPDARVLEQRQQVIDQQQQQMELERQLAAQRQATTDRQSFCGNALDQARMAGQFIDRYAANAAQLRDNPGAKSAAELSGAVATRFAGGAINQLDSCNDGAPPIAGLPTLSISEDDMRRTEKVKQVQVQEIKQAIDHPKPAHKPHPPAPKAEEPCKK